MPKRLNLIGQRFGRLIVLESAGLKVMPSGQTRTLWKCRCDCGNETIVLGYELTAHTRSCGCIRREKCSKLGTSSRGAPGAAVINKAFYECREGAAKRGLEFLIDKETFTMLVHQNCNYCGRPPRALTARNKRHSEAWQKENTEFCNGIDRVDSTRGYILANIVPCCKTCNIAKNNLTLQEFLDWVDTIANFQHQQKSNP
jgi:hypothetical protein